MSALHPALLMLIDDLAEAMVDDYLRDQPASNLALDAGCTNPAPLPGFEQAA